MTAHAVLQILSLTLVVAACWLGVLGMWRMKTPTEALHYLALPGTAGVAGLIAAVFLATGNSQTAWKTVLTGAVLVASNSIVAHATARAFRARALGHWEPLDGDPMERFRPHTEEPMEEQP